MSAEAQLLSRAEEGAAQRPKEDILRAMGRGQGPRFRTKPICPRKGPQEYRIHKGLNELHGLKALLEQRKALTHPTRGRDPNTTMLQANARSIAAMQQDFIAWTGDQQKAGKKLAAAVRYIHSMNEAAINKLVDRVNQLIQEINKVTQAESRASYH